MYNVHAARPIAPPWLKNPCLKIISIDPGETHMCISVQMRCHLLPSMDGIHHPECVRQNKVLSVNKTNLKRRTGLKKQNVSNDMKTVEVDCSIGNLTSENTGPMNLPDQSLANMAILFGQVSCVGVGLIVIEKQLRINKGMTRMGPAIVAHFLTRHPEIPVVELDARLKSVTLAPGQKVLNVKRWSEEYAKRLFVVWGDMDACNMVTTKGKTNDVADTAVQVEAFFVHLKLTRAHDFDLPSDLFFTGKRPKPSVLDTIRKKTK